MANAFRTSAISAVAVLTLLVVAPVTHAQVEQPEPAALPPASPEQELDQLFADLKRESDPGEARAIVSNIWAEWNRSGSATVDLLMQWANEAMEDDRNGTALDLLDQVTVLRPEFAEGWNRRATLHYMMDDHRKSMADINRVLELEPRHFGALSGMAAILSDAGNERLALRAFKRVLDVYPADRNAQRRVGELEEELAGDPV
ncbi:hypothetical protein [Pararhizobium haloflavum]|uniref:hypothetical protein n=1 Tax=Pararhizobium haloflavum TaxID=2037914 RepID=UPI000C199C99|nr:hypothetical protein [Pararhizobium haloflavum]